jgi:dnd system-associated protein 4
MRDLICFAAVLGFNEGVRTPLTGPTAEIDGRTFESSPAAIDLMYLLGLASERDAVILQNEHEDALITAFEEYAATGLLTISSWLNEKPDDEHGDQALLAALRRHGFLDSSRTTIDSVVDQVAF